MHAAMTLDNRGAANPSARPRRSILIVEDEADLVDTLCFNLEREGYTCRKAGDGASGLNEARRQRPDLIILDRMLPVMSGDDLASQIHRDPQLAGIPIIMLTAKADEADELVGFALGVDDYVAKPFSIRNLVARVNAVLRRTQPADTPRKIITSGPFQVDLSRHELSIDGVVVALTATEFRILHALVSANGRVLTRTQLIDTALGTDVAVTDRTIDVHITALRRKMNQSLPNADPASWIQTVRGVGYTFRPPAKPPS